MQVTGAGMANVDPSAGRVFKRPYRGGYRWYGQVKYKDVSGKWRTLQRALTDEGGNPIPTDADIEDEDGTTTRTTRNIRRAERALARWRDDLAGSPTGGRMPVADYITADLDRREGSIQASTMQRYRAQQRSIARAVEDAGLSSLLMRDMEPRHVRAIVQAMKRRGLSRSTIQSQYALLRKVCGRAVEDGDIPDNPCKPGIMREDAPMKESKRPNALDLEGVRRCNELLDATTNDRIRIAARLALMCGLRRGECCGLRWSDVDLDAGTLTVSESIGLREGGTYAKKPKTPGSARRLPMPDALKSELAAWRADQLAEWRRCWTVGGAMLDEAPPFGSLRVIGNPDGAHITPQAVTTAWLKLANDKGLVGTQGRRCTFHDLRHTFATHAILSGADVRSVAALMGHTDPAITLRTYADATREGTERAMRLASQALATGTAWGGQPTDAGTDQRDAGIPSTDSADGPQAS